MRIDRTFAFVLLLALAVRLAFALLAPTGGGDWDIYSTVAENILRGCGVSLSPPDGTACVPHYGGNHLPGYPAFVALIWRLSGHSDLAVRVVQIVLFGLALMRLLNAVAQFTGSKPIAVWTGLVIALSPLEVAWPRFTQTETLSLALTIWFFSELLASLAERRLRTVPMAIATALATFVRLDGILLCVPFALAGFFIHAPKDALRLGLTAGLIIAAPLAAWTARNALLGVRLLPHGMVLPNNAPTPYGYIRWAGTWNSDEYQRMGWAWPVNRLNYDTITIDERAFDSEEERRRVKSWLADLSKFAGQPFPADIDARFDALASERAARQPFRTYIVFPLQRAISLWKNPFSSFGWPNELPSVVGNQERLEASRGAGLLDLAKTYPFRAFSKALNGGYRYLLLISFILIMACLPLARMRPFRPLALVVLAFVLTRTIFFAVTNNVETRYTAPTVPPMEIVVVIGAALLTRRCSVPTAPSTS